MAKTLCRVAGGGKPLKGNAEAGDVLAGKTFSNKQSNALTGSMPNNGALNIRLTPSGNNSTSQAVAAGYYSGGTITANGSSSYSQGVSDADGRVNTSSASYNSGYAKGKAAPTVTAKGSTHVDNYTSTSFYLANGVIVTYGLNDENLETQQILWKHGGTIDVMTTVRSHSTNFVNLSVDPSNTSHVNAYGRYMTILIYEFS